MREIADALRSVLDKLGDFFNILDLSFLVAGTAAFAPISLLAKLANRPLPIPDRGWIAVFAILITCYLSGLICFATGRMVRMGTYRKGKQDFQQKRFTETFPDLVRSHGLDSQEPFKSYLARGEADSWRLYTRLWAEVREKLSPSPSLSLLQRYWVMAATYDGLAAAAVVWMIAVAAWLFHGGLPPLSHLAAGLAVLGLLVCIAFVCAIEAERYMRYQAEELVATIAVIRNG